VSVEIARAGADWLTLREPADAAARSGDLVAHLRPHLPAEGRSVIHDLGCGTGSMRRWLAPQLTGPQHWVMHERDPDLLADSRTRSPVIARDGTAVTVETRLRDITRLDPADLARASLITASALLDMLTADGLDRFVRTCADAGCPALITLSVIGRVEMSPVDPLDERIAGAFNAHQRRTTGDRHLLGPDAVAAAVDAFARLGHEVLVRPSPWLLGAHEAALAVEWLSGWIDAACEQQPDLIDGAAAYSARRLAEAADGRLVVTVHHADILALPR
jgi:trans-aconitate methyltransferase